MTRDDIIRMAREANLWMTSDERIAAAERFAALVAAEKDEEIAELERHVEAFKLVMRYYGAV